MCYTDSICLPITFSLKFRQNGATESISDDSTAASALSSEEEEGNEVCLQIACKS